MIQPIIPTDEQRSIIDFPSNLVAIARPGSGKTFVLSEKIRLVLDGLKKHQGVIAISYTNKASDELKKRVQWNGIECRQCFLGTIDSFCVQEIILPFLPQLWGPSEVEKNIIRISDLTPEEQDQFISIKANHVSLEILQKHLEIVRSYFRGGKLFLEMNGALALYTFLNSVACRRYLRAKYTHIFVDEYQDTGFEQHELFLKLAALGLTSIAMGDADQSIFGFSGKSSKYLLSLPALESFTTLPLTYNHRSHPSIINYSLRILDSNSKLTPVTSQFVSCVNLEGGPIEIATWIGKHLATLVDRFKVTTRSSIGILVRSNNTGEILDKAFLIKHRLVKSHFLEEGFSIWSKLFAKLLTYHFTDSTTVQEIVDDFGSPHLTARDLRDCKNIIRLLKKVELPSLEECVSVAKILCPYSKTDDAIRLLREALQDPNLAAYFAKACDDEVQIMTLHKAKGMEFDIVFHLDLHEFVLPQKGPGPNNDWDNCVFSDWEQDLHLHYVGVTRARKCCILCTSTKRINSKNETKNGKPSEFLLSPGLTILRSSIKEILVS